VVIQLVSGDFQAMDATRPGGVSARRVNDDGYIGLFPQ
jgi:hypothetical protein